MADVLARNGAKLVVVDIQQDWGQKTEFRIRVSGSEARFLRTDVSEEQDVARLVEFAVATTVIKRVADITAEERDWVMPVNVGGVFYGCKHTIRQFVTQGGGAIVNMGSVSSRVGLPERAVYCASKGRYYNLAGR